MKLKSLLEAKNKKVEVAFPLAEDGSDLVYDVYLRPLPFAFVYTFSDSEGNPVSGTDLAVKRISHCVVDEDGKPIFTEEQLLGLGDVSIPPIVIKILNDLIIEENDLGKIYGDLLMKMSSGASLSSTESAEEQ